MSYRYKLSEHEMLKELLKNIKQFNQLWKELLLNKKTLENQDFLSKMAKQIQKLDQIMEQFGFENRSELFRSIIRLITHQPEIINQASVFPMINLKIDPIPQIVDDFRKTNKYSDTFLQDLAEGLENSSIFNS